MYGTTANLKIKLRIIKFAFINYLVLLWYKVCIRN